MNPLLVRLKILPTDVDVNLDEMVESIKTNLPQEMVIKRRMEEPIAYGLVALILDIQTLEKDGAMESLENAVRSSKFVSEVEVLGISRLSTKIS